MQGIVNAVKGTAIGVAGYLTPILKESKFRETGVITPEEFVAAGDHLVYSCPTWQWSAGEAARVKSYLPADKQFLVTRNVPCYKRICQVDSYREESEALVDLEGGVGKAAKGEDAWVDTHHFTAADVASSGPEKAREMELPIAEKKPAAAAASADDEDDDAGVAMDMEQFVQSGMLDASDSAVAMAEVATEATASGAAADAGSNIVETRTYDLFITYDKYYQTPRLWLAGYNEKKKPLTATETYEDISQDHAKKTVTIEAFPHLSAQSSMFSVHPCRHAEVMKKIMETMSQSRTERAETPGAASDNGGLGVHEYLLVFLKFMQAVIPTIEYDFTRNIRLG